MQLNQTAHKILDAAERYTQSRGFNAFSYKDIQNDLGIKTASIHYYFPTKQDLATAMIARYLERYKLLLEDIGAQKSSARKKLEGLSALFGATAEKSEFCLCGMLASDLLALSPQAQTHLKTFFTFTETWLTGIIKAGIASGELAATLDAKATARLMLSILEGGLLVSRTREQARYFPQLIKQWLQLIST